MNKGNNVGDIYLEAEKLADKFKDCSKLLTAIGDGTRKDMLIEMMKMKKCTGVRVGEITKRTNLSRPAVFHHLSIIEEDGIVKIGKKEQ